MGKKKIVFITDANLTSLNNIIPHTVRINRQIHLQENNSRQHNRTYSLQSTDFPPVCALLILATKLSPQPLISGDIWGRLNIHSYYTSDSFAIPIGGERITWGYLRKIIVKVFTNSVQFL